MIAVPVDNKETDSEVSDLFGNVKFFAFYDPASKKIVVKENSGSGNGIKTALFLAANGAKTALYKHLGEGPFKTMVQKGVKIHALGKSTVTVSEAIARLQKDELPEVTPSNAKALLDPGTGSHSCECGCAETEV